jgi:hypothetical protein
MVLRVLGTASFLKLSSLAPQRINFGLKSLVAARGTRCLLLHAATSRSPAPQIKLPQNGNLFAAERGITVLSGAYDPHLY